MRMTKEKKEREQIEAEQRRRNKERCINTDSMGKEKEKNNDWHIQRDREGLETDRYIK
jgi:hypothetical protein